MLLAQMADVAPDAYLSSDEAVDPFSPRVVCLSVCLSPSFFAHLLTHLFVGNPAPKTSRRACTI